MKITSQSPAEGIMLRHFDKSWRYYNVPCMCGCDNRVDLAFEIEDTIDNFITCHVYSEVKTDYWTNPFPLTYNEMILVQGAKELANAVISRLHLCWKVLTRGYVEMESHTMLSTQQATNMATTIVTALKDLENEKAKHRPTKKSKVSSTDSSASV